jgi:hypothetical protein
VNFSLMFPYVPFCPVHMPSESSFKKHCETVREALKTFTTIRSVKAPNLVITAINDLIDATLALSPFTSFFLSHDLFQELPPTVYTVLCNFASENPSVVMPPTMDQLAALRNRVRGSFAQSLKPGKFPCLILKFVYPFLITSFLLEVVVPTAPRADSKSKKTKTATVRLFLFFLFVFHLGFS